MSRKPRLKSTRLFSMQLANHDGLFAPEVKPVSRFRWLRALLFLPAVILFFTPSFKLGLAVLRNPGFVLPDVLSEGDVFVIPADDEDIVPHIAGQPLSYVEAKQPYYLGAAIRGPFFELNFDFDNSEGRSKFKALIERLHHPTFPIFVKRIKVEPAPVSENEPASASTGKKAPLVRTPTPIDARELKLFERTNGPARLRCWKQPSIEPLRIDPLKPRRNARMAAIGAAGAGEVLFAGASLSAVGEMVVLVYHGGGLFTRYWGLKEVRVQKGMKIATGQPLGHLTLAPAKGETIQPPWNAYFSAPFQPTELKASSLLELSSRLCETK